MNKVILMELYVEKNMPIHKIAKQLQCSPGAVFNWLKKHGIETRRRGVPVGFKHSEGVCKIISATHSGKKRTAEELIKMHQTLKKKYSYLSKTGGHKKVINTNYVLIYCPNHCMAGKDGYALEHRFVMSNHLGRPLSDGEVVHHLNHDRKDNRIENLLLMDSFEHSSMHMKERRNISCQLIA